MPRVYHNVKTVNHANNISTKSSNSNSSSSKSIQQVQQPNTSKKSNTQKPAPFIKPAGNDIKHSQLPSYKTATMKSITPIPSVHTSQITIDDFAYDDVHLDNKNFNVKKSVKSSLFKSANKNINVIFNNNTLSVVTIGDRIYNIGNTLGKSRALVFDIESSNLNIHTHLCLKIAPHGDIVFSKKKLQYIHQHADDFTDVYDYSSDVTFAKNLIIDDIDLGKRVDICILEKVDTTLDKLCEKLLTRENFSIKAFSVEFLSYITVRLIEIANNLISNNFCYTDIKAANIGINIHNNKLSIKLIDVDN